MLVSAVLISSGSFASEIRTINPAGKTSPLSVFTQSYTKHIAGASFYQSTDCLDALSKYKDDNILSFASNNAFSGVLTGQACMPKITLDQVYFFGEQYYSICRKTGNTKNFATPNASFGAASVLPVAAIVADVNQQNNFSMRAVPFNGSGAVALQLLSGDLDFGLIGTSLADKHVRSGAMECFASTNPTTPNYWGKTVKGKKLDLRIQILVLSQTQNPKIRAALQTSLLVPDFDEHLNQGGFENVTRQVTIQHLETFKQYLDELTKAYAAK